MIYVDKMLRNPNLQFIDLPTILELVILIVELCLYSGRAGHKNNLKIFKGKKLIENPLLILKYNPFAA